MIAASTRGSWNVAGVTWRKRRRNAALSLGTSWVRFYPNRGGHHLFCFISYLWQSRLRRPALLVIVHMYEFVEVADSCLPSPIVSRLRRHLFTYFDVITLGQAGLAGRRMEMDDETTI